MPLTNNHGLPEFLIRAIENDPYDSGGSDYTPSSLLLPPRVLALKKKYGHELVIDAMSRIRSLHGQAFHKVLERGAGPGDIVEKRYFLDVHALGKVFKISAQIDYLNGGLIDTKTCKAYKFTKEYGAGEDSDWIAQMNIQKYLVESQIDSVPVKSLHILAFLKDWSKYKAMKGGYPEQEVVLQPIPMWRNTDTHMFIVERILLHEEAKAVLPNCDQEETWSGRRCEEWCDAASHCEQYQINRRDKNDPLRADKRTSNSFGTSPRRNKKPT